MPFRKLRSDTLENLNLNSTCKAQLERLLSLERYAKDFVIHYDKCHNALRFTLHGQTSEAMEVTESNLSVIAKTLETCVKAQEALRASVKDRRAAELEQRLTVVENQLNNYVSRDGLLTHPVAVVKEKILLNLCYTAARFGGKIEPGEDGYRYMRPNSLRANTAHDTERAHRCRWFFFKLDELSELLLFVTHDQKLVENEQKTTKKSIQPLSEITKEAI